MKPLPERCTALCVALLVLAGCATTRAPRTLLPPAEQAAALRELDGFSIRGSANVKAGNEGFNVPSLDWSQQADATAVKLSGPIGSPQLSIFWQPGSLRLESSRGQKFEGAEAEQVLLDELGFVPPFAALRYWVLGLEAPGEAASQRSLDESGRLDELTQQQWHIRYNKWMSVAAPAGGVEVPKLLTVTRDDLRLKVNVRRWKL
jgi:outer membrane lipoprotein LolB